MYGILNIHLTEMWENNLLWLAKIFTTGVLHERYEANCLTVSNDNQNFVLSHSFIYSFIFHLSI